MREEILSLLEHLVEQYPEGELICVYGSFIFSFPDEGVQIETWADGWRVMEDMKITTYECEDGEWVKTVEEIRCEGSPNDV